jgi:hypothetical protein
MVQQGTVRTGLELRRRAWMAVMSRRERRWMRRGRQAIWMRVRMGQMTSSSRMMQMVTPYRGKIQRRERVVMGMMRMEGMMVAEMCL